MFRVTTCYEITLSCGCQETVHRNVYDNSGNIIKEFRTKKEAEEAGRDIMIKRKDRSFNIYKV